MSAQQPEFHSDDFLRNLVALPGVYQLLAADGEILYVGKARNLKKRVSTYFRANQPSPKQASLVAQVASVEVTVTNTEAEALLLECNLIKQHRPRYNVLLRDDKSYPYIHLSAGRFPRLSLYRGSRSKPGRFFGPYPGAGAVRKTLSVLQKIFKVRQCEDSFFRNRQRPCLQHQIQRCTAPCTGLIDEASYGQDVENAILFLEGRNSEVINRLVRRMEAASESLAFEEAARYRDQVTDLRQVYERQHVSGQRGDLDIIAAVTGYGAACVQVFVFREGRLLGNHGFHPRIPDQDTVADVLTAFVSQYYVTRDPPAEIIVNDEIDDVDLLTAALSSRAGRRVVISRQVRGERARWVEMAVGNANHALQAKLSAKTGAQDKLQALQDALRLDFAVARLECFDVSHTGGEATVASCVVFDSTGPVKSDYRRYNIEGIQGGDDYGALRQALTRRYLRLKREDGKLPDVLFIDGGKGQVRQAREVLEDLQVDGVALFGVAKGPDRREGLETLYTATGKAIILPAQSPALHVIQQIRDEAHRFAITGHRQRRAKARRTSTLEDIPGIGAKRRQQLLKQFGGLRQLARAGVEDLAGVEGISRSLAQRIYDALHG
jgi:excinuclease ABC subunit C